MSNQTNSIEAPWVVTFSREDSLEERLRKAAHVKPSEAQLAWMEKEYIGFVHFGLNTFGGRQWGTGQEESSLYSPSALDPRQWAEVCANAGMKMAVITAKHHDGFCLWPTETTDFSVANSSEKTDVVGALAQGCRANGIGLGIYLSPWDMNQKKKGLWNTEGYNDYFLAQLRELLTRYGTVDELWFDGACGDYEIWKPVPSYQPESWYDRIDAEQPLAVSRLYDPFLFSSQEEWEDTRRGAAKLSWRGKAVRWVGNEAGKGRSDEWSVQPVFDRTIGENATFPDLGQEKYYEQAVGAVWYPVEVNTTLLNQWFWNGGTSRTKSLGNLIDTFYDSIGNNGVLLLNVSPDSRGLVPEDQVQRLRELKDFMTNTFAVNLVKGARVQASAEAPQHSADGLLDGDKRTYWTTDGAWDVNQSQASIVFLLPEARTFDNVVIQEYVREGQRVAEWSLEAWIEGDWRLLANRKTIGYKRIVRFEPCSTGRVRLNILRSWDTPMLCHFGLYLSSIPDTAGDDGEEALTGPEPEMLNPSVLAQGLKRLWYPGGVQSAAAVGLPTSSVAGESRIVPGFVIQPSPRSIGFSLSFKGYVEVPRNGIYMFRLESADGSVLVLGGTIRIDNDEPHEMKAVEGRVELRAGYHSIKVLYTSFRHAGSLRVSWSGPDFEMQEIQAVNLWHKHTEKE